MSEEIQVGGCTCHTGFCDIHENTPSPQKQSDEHCPGCLCDKLNVELEKRLGHKPVVKFGCPKPPEQSREKIKTAIAERDEFKALCVARDAEVIDGLQAIRETLLNRESTGSIETADREDEDLAKRISGILAAIPTASAQPPPSQ